MAGGVGSVLERGVTNCARNAFKDGSLATTRQGSKTLGSSAESLPHGPGAKVDPRFD